MDSPWPIFILFAVIAVTAVAVGWIHEQRRRKELAAFAQRVGFSFAPGAAYADAQQFHGFTPFGQVARASRPT